MDGNSGAGGYHPSDAYELGRVAATKLKEHNQELSNSLPNALESLFADTEFQQAIMTSGVVTDQRQILTPVSSYQMAASTSSSVSPVRRTRGLISTSSSSPRPTTSNSGGDGWSYFGDSGASSSSVSTNVYVEEVPTINSPGREKGQGRGRNLLNRPGPLSRKNKNRMNRVDDVAVADATGVPVPVSSPSKIPRLELMRCDDDENNKGTEDEELPDKDPFAVIDEESMNRQQNCHQNGNDPHPPLHCVCCNELAVGQEVDEEDQLRRKFLRDMFWVSLAMNKAYNRDSNVFPFCINCIKKMKKLHSICQQVQKLEEEFGEVRNDLLGGVIQSHVRMTKEADTGRLSVVAGKIKRRMKKDLSAVVPGSKLLKQIEGLSGASNSENDKNSGSEEDENNAGLESFECRICDKVCYSEKGRKRHELIHKIKTTDNKGKKTTEKCFQCSVCGRIFTQPGNRDAHERRHRGFRRYECNICGQKYHDKKKLRNHFLARHPGKKVIDNITQHEDETKPIKKYKT